MIECLRLQRKCKPTKSCLSYCLLSYIFLSYRLKDHFVASDALLNRSQLVQATFNNYIDRNQPPTLTQRELGHLIHQTFPSVKCANGPTIDGKRKSIYAGLALKEEFVAPTTEHGYCRKPLGDLTNRQDKTTSIASGLTSRDSESDTGCSTDSDPDYVPYPNTSKNCVDDAAADNTETILELLPSKLRESDNFTHLLTEQIVQGRKRRNTSQRWSVRYNIF